MSYNVLSDFKPNVLQKQLFLIHNNLKSLEAFGNLENLEEIDVSYNELWNGSLRKPNTKPLARSKRLRYVNLKNNKLTVVHTYMFSKLPQISKLDFSKNMVTLFIGERFRDSPVLREINLSRNNLSLISKDVFDKPVQKMLVLACNKIKLVSRSAFFSELEILDLSRRATTRRYNKIQRIKEKTVKAFFILQ